MIEKIDVTIPTWYISDPPLDNAERATAQSLINEHLKLVDAIIVAKGFSADETKETLIFKANKISEELRLGKIPSWKGFQVKFIHVWKVVPPDEHAVTFYMKKEISYIL